MKTILTLTIILMTLNGFSQNLPSYVPNNGLVGFWAMNGTHEDASPNQNPTTNYGVTFGRYRDNPNNQVGIWEPADTNSITGLVCYVDTNGMFDGFSLSFWVKLDSIQFGYLPRFLTWGDPGYWGIQVGVLGPSNEPPSGFWFSQSDQVSSIGNFYYGVQTTDWNNFIYTFNQDSVRFYINSKLVETQVNNLSWSSVGPLIQIGLTDYDANVPGSITGEMDDVGIWNRVLDITEIGNLYRGSLTSTNPIQFQNIIKVYPNPVNDYIQIDCGDNSPMNGYSIKIINLLGITVFEKPVTHSRFSIDMNGWIGNGLYFLHFIDESGNIRDTRKIVLK